MTDSLTPIILVDGSSYLFRAYHALPPLTNSKGQPTGAAKGVINMIRSLQKSYPESPIVVIFDAKGKTFRHEQYKDYKANRPPMPDDLRDQIAPIHAIIKAMGLPLIIEAGVEADDVIGTYAREASAKNIPVIISTGDKDMAQLVDEHVTLINTMNNTTMDVEGVKEKFGIPPELIIDFLALMGDKVDNIPGVAGVGEKTALAMLQQIGSIKEIYERLEDIRSCDFRGAKKMPEKLLAEKDNALLSYELATIKCDVELHHAIDELQNGAPNNDELLKLYTELEFKTWIKEVSDGDVIETEDKPIETNYQTVTTQSGLNDWISKIKKAPLVAFDTETTSLDFMEARIVGVSFSVQAGEACYIPLAHDYMGVPEQLDPTETLNLLKPLLEDPKIKKVGQNLKYDAHVLLNHDITLQGIAQDTMLESYLYHSTANRHDMDTLSEKFLNHETIHFEDIAGKGKKQLTFNQIAIEVAAPYAAEDADITLRLHEKLFPLLSQQKKPLWVYENIDLPLVNVLTQMEHKGCLIDTPKLKAQSKELEKSCLTLQAKAFELAGEEFNLDSPKQLQVILFEKLGLPIIKKTPKGQPSTAEPVLQELADQYELPSIIMQYRSMRKLKSTYTDALPEQINPATGRVHTSYHQAVTATGRLSSKDPNLQNIPVKNEEGRRIRKAFIAPKGKKIVAADYSQVELRIMAHLSGDQGLLNAFKEGADIHSATASEVFDTPIDEVTSEQRRNAKAINFGLIYGMSAFGLSNQLGVDRGTAQSYIDAYFERFAGVKDYMARIKKTASEQGYVETLFGRRLYLPEINSKNGMQRQAAERVAINAPMQGTAADIIKAAMIAINNKICEFDDTFMLMQVHDELVFELPEQNVEQFSQFIIDNMQNAANLDVPLIVDVGVGDNWEEAH
ncbi:MAG: DNA polymerase I [Cellvibrionales bacterium]|nr:DNA polymerase I [Cellvibrionales bacterium]